MLIDFPDIVQGFFRMLLPDQAFDGGEVMARVMAQDPQAAFADAGLFNFRTQRGQLHGSKLTVLLRPVLQFIFLEIYQKKDYIGQTHGKGQKFHDYLAA